MGFKRTGAKVDGHHMEQCIRQCRTCTLLQVAETYKNGVEKDYRQLGMLIKQFVISCHENKHKALHQKRKQRS
jgi:hypothetical protein